MLRIATALALPLVAAFSPQGAAPHDPAWDAFKAKYKKSYKDADDEAARYSLFKSAEARVAELNKLNGQKAFGINWMSDRCAPSR